MAVSYAVLVSKVPGDRKRVQIEATGDTSYPTGGYAYAASDFGLISIEDVKCLGVSSGSGYAAILDRANAKVKLMKGNGVGVLIDETNATNVSTVKYLLEATGW